MTGKVIVLTTGGTIGHRSRKDGVAVMDFDPGRLVSEIARPQIDIEFRDVLRKGSMDIGPQDWRTIAGAVREAFEAKPRGVVILHGTDTMHYTAAALSFMLQDLPAPVAMTGSMIPGGDDGSDAMLNLRDALDVAAQADFAEVCIVFSADRQRSGGVIIRGCCARKVHSHAIDAFASINAPPIGTIAGGSIARSSLKVRPRASSTPRLAAELDLNVVLVKLTPNIAPEALARMLDGASGVVLEGTGVGHIRTDLQPVVERFGHPVAVSTQASVGGERLGLYEVDHAILAISNVIPVGDMTPETALVKMMWALGQGADVKSVMLTDISGEMAGGHNR